VNAVVADRRRAAADAAALDDLAVDDFALVGPAGFVLDKQQWLERYRSGALRHSKFEWSEEALRLYGEAAIALGRQAQRATYNGHPRRRAIPHHSPGR
jgi:hypothetical protein